MTLTVNSVQLFFKGDPMKIHHWRRQRVVDTNGHCRHAFYSFESTTTPSFMSEMRLSTPGETGSGTDEVIGIAHLCLMALSQLCWLTTDGLNIPGQLNQQIW